MKSLRVVLIGLASVFVLVCCTKQQQAYHAVTVQPSEQPGMMFLTFKMVSDSSHTNRIELIGKVLVNQPLNAEAESYTAPNRIIISQLDHAKNVLLSVSHDHPLNRRVEVPSETGEFESRTLTLPEAEFFVRVTYMPQTAYIRVQEVVQDNVIYEKLFNLNE